MRKTNENQTEFDEGGFGGSGVLKDGTVEQPLSGSTVKSWVMNDVINAFAAILKASGRSSFNGAPETEDSSEILTAINTIIDNKINAAKSELIAKIDQCAKLDGVNYFTAVNHFNNNVFMSQTLRVTQDATFNGNILSSSSKYIDQAAINSLNYVNSNTLENKLKTKVTIDTNTQIGENDKTRPTNFEIGTTLLAARNHESKFDNEIKRINAQVYPYYFDDFDPDDFKEMTVTIKSTYSDYTFPGTWLVKGFVKAQDKGFDKDIYMITRIG